MNSFSERFCKRRKELNLSQKTVADKLNVGYRTVSHWENGSFPDGEMLPKIADFFGVSLDYLFGRDNEKKSIEQEVLSDFQKKTDVCTNDYSEILINKIFDLLWAIQISWGNKDTVYCKNEDVNYKKASIFLLDKGFSFFQHKKGSRFYCLCEKPEGGLDSILANGKDITAFFRFLGDEDNQNILIFLLKLESSEFISINSLSQKLGIGQEKIHQAIKFLKNLKNDNDVSIISEIKHTNSSGKTELLYNISVQKSFIFLMFFVLTNEILKPTMLFDNSFFLPTDSFF